MLAHCAKFRVASPSLPTLLYRRYPNSETMKASRKKHRRFPPRNGKSPTPDGPPQRLTVELERPGHQGEAVGRREDGKIVLASYGIAGERVVVEVREEHPTYIVAEVVEVLRPSPERVEPRCPHFGACGGCQLQHISYEEQGRIKQSVLIDQLRRIGHIVDPPVSKILAAENPWNYRNNARFTVRREGATGFTHWHTHRFEPIDECLIMDPRINDIKRKLDGALINRERQLAVRIGHNTEDTLVHPALDSRGDERDVGTGQESYEERLFNVPFRVSAASFFQVNTAQAERMMALVRDRLQPTSSDTIVDAYAGVGTIAALIAPMVGRVIAIEESAAAVRDAQVNLAPFPNVEMVLAKTEEALPELDERVDAVILDPPRAGCYAEVIDALRRLQPRRIVYVSCDPATLARDLNRLILGGYMLTDVTPVDMFPHTYHIESVSTLERMPSDGFILASTSARRREILTHQNAPFASIAPATNIEESADSVIPASDPITYAQDLALRKAQSVADENATIPVIGADTVVVAPDGSILNKPQDADEARRMLQTLRESDHQVITAIAVIPPGDNPEPVVGHEITVGRMRVYTDEEIEDYIATGDPFDKAGAYGIQHPEFRPVAELNGCYLNVVGLPLCLLNRLLTQARGVTYFPHSGESRNLSVIPSVAEESKESVNQPTPLKPTKIQCAYCAQRTPRRLRMPESYPAHPEPVEGERRRG